MLAPICKMSLRRFVTILNSTRTKYLLSSRSNLSSLQHDLEKPEKLPANQEVDDGAILDPFARVSKAQKNYLEELRPPMRRSFNLAAYVNDSKTLQELIKLGVSLFDIENTNSRAAQYYVTLDFDRDCVEHIKFLVDNGLKEKNLGRFISEFPLVFMEHIDDLQTRLNYFESKGFSKESIAKALNRSSMILSKNTKTIDHKLGQLQIEFNLPAKVLRNIIRKHPTVIGIPEEQYRLINFTISDEFGFEMHEMHKILEAQPKVIDILRPILIERLDLIHNQMGFSHATIVKYPKLITGPRFDIHSRFFYLKKLKRDQFDYREPLYVPPSSLYSIDDEEFCYKYAKTNLADYKLFIKSC